MQYVQRAIATLAIPELYTQYGRWWGSNPARKRQEEIDLVCTNATDILCGECKWQNQPVEPSVLRPLQERAALIAHGRRVHLAIFAKQGFTPALQQVADRQVRLITLADMVS